MQPLGKARDRGQLGIAHSGGRVRYGLRSPFLPAAAEVTANLLTYAEEEMNQLFVPLERQQFGTLPDLFDRTQDPQAQWNPSAQFPARMTNDAISTLRRPQTPFGPLANLMLGSAPGAGSIAAIIQQIFGMLQQLLGSLTGGATENAYRDASASSTGDPHLAFSGTQANGTTQNAHFDSMTAHESLLDSDSFSGGYRIATQVTAPNANGITSNKSATITSNYGLTQVSLDNQGAATILSGGAPVQIAAGQTLDLGNGETVTKNNDGSLGVINVDGNGGTMNTTLRVNAGGVDVSSTAHAIDLGGDILGAPAQMQPQRALL